MPSELFGLFYGIVDAEKKDPDNLDRLRVKLDRDQMAVHWAEVMHPTALYALPDPGDTVVVAFIAGDPDRPVILGGVWNDPNPPPEANKDGKNNHRGYRSRTGHRLVFEDGDKPKLVFIDMKGKNVIGLGEFASGGSGPNACTVFAPPMASGSGAAISATEGSLEIACKGQLSVTAENIKINAKKTLQLSSTGAMTFDGKTKVKLSSSLLGIEFQVMAKSK